MLQFAELIRSPPLPKFLSPIKEVSFQVPATPSPQKKRQVVVKPLVLSSQKAEKKAVSQMRPMKPVNSTSTPSHQMHFQKVKKPKKKSQGKIIRGIRKYFGMPPSLITPINELLDFTKVTIDQRLKPRSMNETQNLFEPIMLKMIPETVSSSQVKETEETKELDQPTATELDNIEYFEELQRELVSIIQEEIIPKQAQLNETLEGDHSTASQLENIEYIEELQRELVPKIQEEITQALFNENSKEDQSTETELENLEYIEDVDTNIEEIEETVPEDIDELLLSEILNQLEFESPQSPTEFLHEVDFTHEPITIPLSSEDDEVAEIFSVPPKKLELGNIESSPQSPFPEHPSLKYEQPKEIPSEDLSNFAGASNEKINDLVLNFDPKIRATILKSHKQILVKNEDKKLCKLRKSIKVFLDEEWTSETTQTCFDCLSKNPKEHLLSLALLETVDDHGLDEISYEFTPPAPPLPKYQQKLILLVKKLKPLIPGLARKLLDGLEQRLFSFDAGQLDLDTLSNYSYLYAALVDLFLSGDHSILFHFIYKSIYFHGYKALQMAFVVLKSCPLTLPKKSYFLEGGDTILKFEEIDPLVLTVMQILSNTESYHDKKHESYAMKDHEMFRYFPRHYGFPLNFLKSEQILKLLVGHIQVNKTF